MEATEEERDLPTGVEYRGDRLWIRFGVNGRKLREPCPKGVTSPRAAARHRAERIVEEAGGQGGNRRGKVTAALDAVLAHYEKKGRRSLDSARGRANAVERALGHVRIIDLTPAHIDRASAAW